MSSYAAGSSFKTPDEPVGQRHGRDHGTIGPAPAAVTRGSPSLLCTYQPSSPPGTWVARGRGSAQAAPRISGVPILQRSVEAFLDHARERGHRGAAAGDPAAPPPYLCRPSKPVRWSRAAPAPGLGGVGVRAGVARRRHRGGARRGSPDGLGGASSTARWPRPSTGAALAALRATDTVKRGNADGLVIEPCQGVGVPGPDAAGVSRGLARGLVERYGRHRRATLVDGPAFPSGSSRAIPAT